MKNEYVNELIWHSTTRGHYKHIFILTLYETAEKNNLAGFNFLKYLPT